MQFINRVFVSILVLALVACDQSITVQSESSAAETQQPLDSRPEPSGKEFSGEAPALSESERQEESIS